MKADLLNKPKARPNPGAKRLERAIRNREVIALNQYDVARELLRWAETPSSLLPLHAVDLLVSPLGGTCAINDVTGTAVSATPKELTASGRCGVRVLIRNRVAEVEAVMLPSGWEHDAENSVQFLSEVNRATNPCFPLFNLFLSPLTGLILPSRPTTSTDAHTRRVLQSMLYPNGSGYFRIPSLSPADLRHASSPQDWSSLSHDPAADVTGGPPSWADYREADNDRIQRELRELPFAGCLSSWPRNHDTHTQGWHPNTLPKRLNSGFTPSLAFAFYAELCRLCHEPLTMFPHVRSANPWPPTTGAKGGLNCYGYRNIDQEYMLVTRPTDREWVSVYRAIKSVPFWYDSMDYQPAGTDPFAFRASHLNTHAFLADPASANDDHCVEFMSDIVRSCVAPHRFPELAEIVIRYRDMEEDSTLRGMTDLLSVVMPRLVATHSVEW